MCDMCNSGSPSLRVQLRHNVGMLFMRQTYETDARLCVACLGRAFRKHQLLNLLLGWWGMISFFMTWVFLITNSVAYFRTRKELGDMTARREQQRFVPEGSPSERLAPFRHNVRLRLRRGESAAAIAADLATLHQVPPASAQTFVDDIASEPATESVAPAAPSERPGPA